MKFKQLEVIGFKSFADKTSFYFEDGLTGIVGPNGCGKSNIVEALRWCMGETSAKSLRGSGMEDVIFSGTTSRPSKNLSEVALKLENDNRLPQFKDMPEIEVRRKIEKDKGSKYFLNGREVRAKDVQILFADLSTGPHSPSMVSQGRVGSLVTAKPTDRRAILEEAAGIGGLHVRRHEAELRLTAAENNLKKADDIMKQIENQLKNLLKQAEEATKYKDMSNNIQSLEAKLVYFQSQEIEGSILGAQEELSEVEDEISAVNIDKNFNENALKEEGKEIKPLRDENAELNTKLQRLNLEFEQISEEENRAKNEIEKIKKEIKQINIDIDREKQIVNDATSNEKRLSAEKNDILEINQNSSEIEEKANNSYQESLKELNQEQDLLNKLSDKIFSQIGGFDFNLIKNKTDQLSSSIKEVALRLKKLSGENDELDSGAIKNRIDEIQNEFIKMEDLADKINFDLEAAAPQANLNSDTTNALKNEFIEKIKTISELQEKYASRLSKYESIKQEATKRKGRLSIIESEIKNWIDLKENSEKKFLELNERFKENENALSLEEAKPGSIAEKKGTYVQNIKNIEEDILQINEKLTSKEDSVQSINQKLYDINTTVLGITERKVRAQTIIEGLKEKKKEIELKSLTDFKHPIAELPTFAEIDVDEQVKTSEIENQIQKLKDRRERMGAVNLRADNETQELQDQIDRMMNDRKDLVQGIQKLKSSINDLNEKGRERLLDAFEKVSRKFNDVYTKLFAGGNARLELIESDDPLEAGLELLVSPPGKKLQSITLLSGGEQALTAMALIFAVFLINPSPICILDEVDAPLDDANVTRFCSLLDELSSVTDTKFVVITHHALTMSRMNRLYGVTMAERGVSQLVAVDLEKAEEMVA
ncbi:AAA family ATPase [bacterium]|jgi:chromosome segregation protein|nr:AAA family ATPase [bacterium]MDC0425863.1 AAA family ATPase [Pelagibacteraceae bacterium]